MERAEILAIKDKANENVLLVLDKLGVEYTERYQYVYSSCPIHNGDRLDGWSWHLQLGVFQCYTRGCHSSGKDIISLVMGVNKCSFTDALKFLKNTCGFTEIDFKDVVERQKNKQFIRSIKKASKKEVVYPEECLKALQYHDYLETRGFTRAIVEEFQIGIGTTPGKKMYNRIVFPIRNLNGIIVGFTGRDITGNGPKWIHSFDFDKDNNLFNMDRALQEINNTSSVILVEGPIDVLRLEESGIKNSVAVLGRSLTNGQLKLLMKSGASKLVFAFDGDAAGKTGIEQGKKTACAFFDISEIKLPEGKDIGDLSIEQVKEIVFI